MKSTIAPQPCTGKPSGPWSAAPTPSNSPSVADIIIHSPGPGGLLTRHVQGTSRGLVAQHRGESRHRDPHAGDGAPHGRGLGRAIPPGQRGAGAGVVPGAARSGRVRGPVAAATAGGGADPARPVASSAPRAAHHPSEAAEGSPRRRLVLAVCARATTRASPLLCPARPGRGSPGSVLGGPPARPVG